MKFNQYIDEMMNKKQLGMIANVVKRDEKDAETYRKIVLDWFKSVPKNKKNTKKMHDMIWMVNLYKKYGKIKVDYRDNKSGNVVPYIHNRATSGDSIWTAENIGLTKIFNLGR